MKFPTLYTKDNSGDIRVWEISTDEAEVIVKHGKEGGKITSKSYFAEAKNTAKSNATTPSEQAEKEAEAKHTLQLKRGYFLTREEALNSVAWEPMKCQDYKDYAHKVSFPCYIQPKLNGLRMMITSDGMAFSKSGEPYTLPEHIKKDINDLKVRGLLKHGLDGEIYAGLNSLSLQEIISAFRKPNENTKKLNLWVYDIPVANMTFVERLKQLFEVAQATGVLQNIKMNKTIKIYSWEDGNNAYTGWVKGGYEGAVYRNSQGLYEHGKRSYDVIKRKPRLTAEALVHSVKKDKSGQGILSCVAVNGVQEGVAFKCLMKKDADNDINYRLYENACTLTGKHVEYEYEELSDKNIPTKPCGVRVREMKGNIPRE
jgi:DNA ligase-1